MNGRTSDCEMQNFMKKSSLRTLIDEAGAISPEVEKHER